MLVSQNRQTAKDRVRSDIEYDVNLRAELEIAQLHEKIDQLSASVLMELGHLRGGTNAPAAMTAVRLHDASSASGGHGYEAHTEAGS